MTTQLATNNQICVSCGHWQRTHWFAFLGDCIHHGAQKMGRETCASWRKREYKAYREVNYDPTGD